MFKWKTIDPDRKRLVTHFYPNSDDMLPAFDGESVKMVRYSGDYAIFPYLLGREVRFERFHLRNYWKPAGLGGWAWEAHHYYISPGLDPNLFIEQIRPYESQMEWFI